MSTLTYAFPFWYLRLLFLSARVFLPTSFLLVQLLACLPFASVYSSPLLFTDSLLTFQDSSLALLLSLETPVSVRWISCGDSILGITHLQSNCLRHLWLSMQPRCVSPLPELFAVSNASSLICILYFTRYISMVSSFSYPLGSPVTGISALFVFSFCSSLVCSFPTTLTVRIKRLELLIIAWKARVIPFHQIRFLLGTIGFEPITVKLKISRSTIEPRPHSTLWSARYSFTVTDLARFTSQRELPPCILFCIFFFFSSIGVNFLLGFFVERPSKITFFTPPPPSVITPFPHAAPLCFAAFPGITALHARRTVLSLNYNYYDTSA